MGWLEWLGVVGGVVAVFVLWDLIFCGGKRCNRFTDLD